MSFSFFIFVLLPVLEIFLFVLVGEEIGGGNTLLLTILTSFAGISLLRSQWIRSGGMRGILWGISASDSLSPAFHRLLFYFGTVLLIIPGFFTDAVGILLLFPWGRRLFYRVFQRWFQKNQSFSAFTMGNGSPGSFFFGNFSPFFSGAFREENFERNNRPDEESINANVPSPSASDTNGDDIIDVDWTVRK